ncbi:GDP-mannose mannosyl hydrolase [Proteobacteria bacterium 005FR1]|nr:GDP-mannose mannosyl hydrolase [Proteobacteria bacterium 005FR1]
MWLDKDVFTTVVESTPLVSIDLIVRDSRGRILLGKRLNRPAQGFWFVPGGRVLKNESLDQAFIRLTEAELGQRFERGQAQPIGVFEHFYDDGAVEEGVSTHYVVLGYLLPADDLADRSLPSDQHTEYCWWSPENMKKSPDVHRYTTAYLEAIKKSSKLPA